MSVLSPDRGGLVGLVDGNNFYVSCERVVDPKLNGKPVAGRSHMTTPVSRAGSQADGFVV